MTKLLIIFLSSLAGLMGGLCLSGKTGAREKYFTSLVELIERLISDISFCHSNVEKILTEYTPSSPNLGKNMDEYLLFVRGEGELILTKGILNKRESNMVEQFFLRLGTLDLDAQINELESRKNVFNNMKETAAERNKRYGKAFIKLGYLCGLLLGILLI